MNFDRPPVLLPRSAHLWLILLAFAGLLLCLPQAESADPPVKLTGVDREPFLFQTPAVSTGILVGDQPQRVYSVAASPAGNVFAVGNEDGRIRIYDANSGSVIRTLEGHEDAVNGVAFSADGNTLASASGDVTLALWDVATGKQRHTLTGHTAPVLCVAFSPDGKLLVSGGEDDTLRVWSLPNGDLHRTLTGNEVAIRSVAFSADGSRLVSCNDDIVHIWDTQKWTSVAKLTGHTGNVRCAVFTPDAKSVISGSEDQTVRIWDVAEAKELRQLMNPQTPIWGLAISPRGTTVVTTGADNLLRIWDYQSGFPRQFLPGHTASITSLAFVPKTGALITGSHDRTAKLWGNLVPQQAPLAILLGHTDILRFVRFSPDGKSLVTGGHDQTATIWDLGTGKLRHVLKGHAGGVTCGAISPNGKLLATGSWDQTLRLWSLSTGEAITQFPTTPTEIRAVAFAPDSLRVAFGGSDRFVSIANINNGGEVKSYLAKRPINGLAFAPDGRTLVVATGKAGDVSEPSELIVLDAKTGKELAQYQPHGPGEITDVSYSGNGALVATSSADVTVRILDTHNYQVKHSLPMISGAYSAALLADPEWVGVSEWIGRVSLWNIKQPSPHVVFTGHDLDGPGGQRATYSVAASPDGSLLASAGRDNSVRLWPTRLTNSAIADPSRTSAAAILRWTDGTMLTQFNLTQALRTTELQDAPLMNCVAFAPDGDTIAVGGDGGRLGLVTVSTRELRQITTDHSHSIYQVNFSSDSKRLAVGGPEGAGALWDVAGSTKLAPLAADMVATDVVSYVPGGELLITGSRSGQISLRDGKTGVVQTKLESGCEAVTSLDVSPNGKLCVAGHADSWISLWDPTQATLLLKWKAHVQTLTAVACSPDGRLVVTGAATSDPAENLKVWDAANSNLVTTLKGHARHIRTIKFSPSGELLATLSIDGMLLIWNLKSNSVMSTLSYRGPAIDVDWARNGKSLAVLRSDGVVWHYVIDASSTRLVLGGLRNETDLAKFLRQPTK